MSEVVTHIYKQVLFEDACSNVWCEKRNNTDIAGFTFLYTNRSKNCIKLAKILHIAMMSINLWPNGALSN